MSISNHLRRIADGPIDAIDADYLMSAAAEIERLCEVMRVQGNLLIEGTTGPSHRGAIVGQRLLDAIEHKEG